MLVHTNNAPVLDVVGGLDDEHHVEQEHQSEVDVMQGRQEFVAAKARARFEFVRVLHAEQQRAELLEKGSHLGVGQGYVRYI